MALEPGNRGDGQGAVRASGDGGVRAEISPEALRPEDVRTRASEVAAGAVVLFVGTVRRTNRGRDVVELAYEAYAEMAAEELVRVGEEARERFDLEGIDAVHRVGRLTPGDAAVAVAASSEHRGPAFEATRWVMAELKRRVPIWKRETYADGTVEWLGEDEHGATEAKRDGAADGAVRKSRKGEMAS